MIYKDPNFNSAFPSNPYGGRRSGPGPTWGTNPGQSNLGSMPYTLQNAGSNMNIPFPGTEAAPPPPMHSGMMGGGSYTQPGIQVLNSGGLPGGHGSGGRQPQMELSSSAVMPSGYGPGINDSFAPVAPRGAMSSDVLPYQASMAQTAQDATDDGGKTGGWWEWLKGSAGNLAGLTATAGTIAGALNSANQTTASGHAIQDYLENMGTDLNTGSQFQGYGVSTGLGNGSSDYQAQFDEGGNPILDSDGKPVMKLVTDFGLSDTYKNQSNWFQQTAGQNYSDAANAYKAMGQVNSGQSNSDFNAMANKLQYQADQINPTTGWQGERAQGLMDASDKVRVDQGWQGKSAQGLLADSRGINVGQGRYEQDYANQLGRSQLLGVDQGWSEDRARQAAANAMADPSKRQNEIYQQMMALQNPELNRQQAEQQAAQYAKGRSGIRGSQYGGTAEDAAMARARSQASNQAVLNAMQQADSERSMFGQMSSQFGQIGNQKYANEASRENSLANSAAQLGGLGQQNYSNTSNYRTALTNAATQMANSGNQNYANASNYKTALANASTNMANSGNQNYANMANFRNQLNNSAAAFGGLGNQANQNAIQKMGMLSTMGNQLAQLGNQNYQNSFTPMQQQLEAMKLGMGNADMAQTGQLTGLDYMAQLGLGGANANINAQHSANQLTGNLYNTLLSNLGGVQGTEGDAGSGLMGVFGDTFFGEDGFFKQLFGNNETTTP